MSQSLVAGLTAAALLFSAAASAAPGIPAGGDAPAPAQRRERPAAVPFVLPQGVHAIRDITYSSVSGRQLKLDLYLPAQAHAARPLVIWVHGGAWRRGSKNDFPARNPLLATELLNNGYALASVEYRLSGEAVFPAQQQDIAAALQFLAEHSDEYGLNRRNFLLGGRSAGAHLAALAAVSASGQEAYTIRALAVFFGIYDLAALETQKARANAANAPEALLLGAPPSARPAEARAASPIRHVSPQSPPAIILHGLADTNAPAEQSRAFHAALQQNGVTSQLHLLERARHGDPVFDTAEPVGNVVEFFNRHRLAH